MIVARIDGAGGNCRIPGYDSSSEGWFLVESVDFGFDTSHVQAKDAVDGGRDVTLGKRDETTITLNKNLDSASCALMYQAMNERFVAKGREGKPATADIHFIENIGSGTRSKSGKEGQGVVAYLRISLGTVKVRSWNISGSSDARPNESVTLWFEQLAMKYESSVDGKVYKLAGEASWDQRLAADKKDRSWKPSSRYYTAKHYPEW
jgi:type VI protein secretion system component Hcp